MHLVLTGATGLVGSGVLHHMIVTPSISKVSVLSRRPVPQAEGHAKINVIIHKDFSVYPSELLEQLKDVDGVVWAQGISVTKVTKEEYVSITETYPLSFARALSKTTSPKPVNFVYVSGEGATPTPSFLTSYFGVIKGRTEASLLALSKDPSFSNLRPYSVRPAGVDAAQHTEIHGFVPTKVGIERYAQLLLPPLRLLYPAFVSPTSDLGRVLSGLATGEIAGGGVVEGSGVTGEGRTLNNSAFRRLAGL